MDGTRGTRAVPQEYVFDPPQQHAHSQSIDYAQPIGNVLSSESGTRLGLRALSPARQASLPTRMPSSYAAVSANSSADQIYRRAFKLECSPINLVGGYSLRFRSSSFRPRRPVSLSAALW